MRRGLVYLGLGLLFVFVPLTTMFMGIWGASTDLLALLLLLQFSVASVLGLALIVIGFMPKA